MIKTVTVHISQIREHSGGNFGLIDPNVGREIGMIVIHPCIDISHDHAVRASRGVPGRGGIDAPDSVSTIGFRSHTVGH